ncbi:MAG: pyridoxal 5'-phosphate synthase glutaminase subunit PdxT [Chloroflexi bacterium]|nr:pyridoxal 5'-phosphate synthase glutaminase subunit PdxT [Chloroflexota bacterium]
MTTIGVLALQGAFVEHEKMLRRLGVETRQVRLPAQLRGLDGLIIPGGESTTIGRLATTYDLIDPLRHLAEEGFPVWGTCAGMILLARDIGRRQPLIGVMDMRVERNAFGRQVDSFETDLVVPALDSVASAAERGLPFHAIFIRAPSILSVGKDVQILAALDDNMIVAAQQGNLLATAFHPELGDDSRFHRYFLRLVECRK